MVSPSISKLILSKITIVNGVFILYCCCLLCSTVAKSSGCKFGPRHPANLENKVVFGQCANNPICAKDEFSHPMEKCRGFLCRKSASHFASISTDVCLWVIVSSSIFSSKLEMEITDHKIYVFHLGNHHPHQKTNNAANFLFMYQQCGVIS